MSNSKPITKKAVLALNAISALQDFVRTRNLNMYPTWTDDERIWGKKFKELYASFSIDNNADLMTYS